MSDLLNSASLVLIPSGYKEDTVYSVVPSDGSGDLSFTRASNGTRVNSAGLVEVCPWNLLQYSEDFTNAVWSTTSTTITADNTTAPNGTATADKVEISSSSNARVQQIINSNLITGGLPCTFSVYIKSVSGTGNVGIRSGQTGLSSVFSYTNQWQRFEWTFNANALSEIMQFCNNTLVGGADSAPSFFAWGCQLNIGSTAKPYFPTTDRLNVPRLTYQNGGGGCPSLLLEKQSTNIMYPSEDFTNANYSGANYTMVANDATSPDGTQNADKFTTTSTSADNYMRYGTFAIISNIGSSYTTTIYAKKGTADFLIIRNLFVQNGASNGRAWFNLNTGAVGTVQSSQTASMQSMGNGWYRCVLTGVVGSTNTYDYIDFAFTNADNTVWPSANVNGYLWGSQLESGSYATSYIVSTSSSATRVADFATTNNISSLFGSTEGSFFIEMTADFTNTNGSIPLFLRSSINSTFNRATYLQFGSGTIALNVYLAGALEASIFSGSYTQGQKLKIAFAYKQNDFVLYINGSLIGTDTSGNISASLAFIDLGTYNLAASTFQYNGAISEVVLFATRLTNTQLAQLTA